MSEAERRRLLAELERRDREIAAELYASWNPAELLVRQERERLAARLLRSLGAFPEAGQPCLEIGCGRLGWLATLLGWGLEAPDLHGLDLAEDRVTAARRALPGADIRVGDAAEGLPWPGGTFQIVILSTVLTSVLDPDVRRRVAAQAAEALAPDGVLVCYDFRWNNPRNPAVRRLGRAELRRLFPELSGPVRTLTLAPPLARRVAPWSSWLVATLSLLPFLRSHLLAVLVRRDAS